MKTVSDIIDAFGGNTAMARIVSKGASTVSEMRRRGRIDVTYWPKLVAASADAEIAARDGREVFTLTNDILVAAHTIALTPDTFDATFPTTEAAA